jgi:hypothetical protein
MRDQVMLGRFGSDVLHQLLRLLEPSERGHDLAEQRAMSRRTPRSSSLRARSRRGTLAGTLRGSARTSCPRRTADSLRRRRLRLRRRSGRAPAPAATC